MSKKFLYGILLMALPAIAGAQAVNYSINGQVKGLKNGEVELSSYDIRTRVSQQLGTAKITNGKFTAKGHLAGAQMVSLNLKPGNWGTQFFIDGGAIQVQIDTTGAQHYDYTKYGMQKGASLKAVKVTGSAGQTDFERYQKAGAGTDREAAAAKQLAFIKQYIGQKTLSVAGPYMLNQYYLFNTDLPLADFESMLARFEGPAKQSVYFSNLQQEVDEIKAVLPGQLAEDFTLLKPDSSKFTLSSLRGKYVLLDFWASWCKPCREAIPHWKEVYARYKDKGFEIVGVTNDNKWDLWKKAMDQEKMDWIQVADEFPVKNMPARIVSKYKSRTIPLYVLLDKEGKILVKTDNKAEIDQKLSTLL
ncbi:TlpA disulfide reductase family protein [Pedobacter kyungheensis]|uniref:TlpA disulfide reductase family protein n=1 Tax=Pedobacter kyungheensis TaxID=1069985 RepID=UPI00068A1E3A|nr:TlpA disulfide reductase family protein [Pedobacter kyungheensis]